MIASNNEKHERINTLLVKADGDIAKLSFQEIREMNKLLSNEIAKEYDGIRDKLYNSKTPVAALLLEEMWQRRMTRSQMYKKLGLSREHFEKILLGKSRIGFYTIRAIQREFGIDANYLVKNR